VLEHHGPEFSGHNLFKFHSVEFNVLFLHASGDDVISVFSTMDPLPVVFVCLCSVARFEFLGQV